MKAQAKYMKMILPWNHLGGGGQVNYFGAKKLSEYGEEPNTLVTLDIAKTLKMSKKPKSKDMYNSVLEDESE